MANVGEALEKIVVDEAPIFGCTEGMAPVLERLYKAGYTSEDLPGSEMGLIFTPGKDSPPLHQIFSEEEIYWWMVRGGYIHTETDWKRILQPDCSDLLNRESPRSTVFDPSLDG